MSEFIKFRNIDADGDWCFGNGLQDYGDNLISTAQNIKTRLLSFKYDCFFDLTAGIDWFNILARRGRYARDIVEINIRLCILQSLYVTELIDLVVIENEDRSLNVTYTVNTIFGEIYDTTTLGGRNV